MFAMPRMRCHGYTAKPAKHRAGGMLWLAIFRLFWRVHRLLAFGPLQRGPLLPALSACPLLLPSVLRARPLLIALVTSVY